MSGQRRRPWDAAARGGSAYRGPSVQDNAISPCAPDAVSTKSRLRRRGLVHFPIRDTRDANQLSAGLHATAVAAARRGREAVKVDSGEMSGARVNVVTSDVEGMCLVAKGCTKKVEYWTLSADASSRAASDWRRPSTPLRPPFMRLSTANSQPPWRPQGSQAIVAVATPHSESSYYPSGLLIDGPRARISSLAIRVPPTCRHLAPLVFSARRLLCDTVASMSATLLRHTLSTQNIMRSRVWPTYNIMSNAD